MGIIDYDQKHPDSRGDRMLPSIRECFQGAPETAPVLALVTLTSENTLERALELLAALGRPCLVLAVADHPQDDNRAKQLAKARERGLEQLREFCCPSASFSPAVMVLSRAAFNEGQPLLAEDNKELFMNCARHLLWLVLTHHNSVTLVRSWWEVVRTDPTARWSPGHLQADTSALFSSGRIDSHTLLQPTAFDPIEVMNSGKQVAIHAFNHLGLWEDREKMVPLAAHLFREGGKRAFEAVCQGVDAVAHESHLLDRLDVIVLNKVKIGGSEA